MDEPSGVVPDTTGIVLNTTLFSIGKLQGVRGAAGNVQAQRKHHPDPLILRTFDIFLGIGLE
jgi:hypothetical protein